MADTPTRYRWKLALLMFLISFAAYMDRVNLSTTTPLIMQEFEFTKIDMGLMLLAGAFIGPVVGPALTVAVEAGSPAAILVTVATTLVGVVAWLTVRPDVPLQHAD